MGTENNTTADISENAGYTASVQENAGIAASVKENPKDDNIKESKETEESKSAEKSENPTESEKMEKSGEDASQALKESLNDDEIIDLNDAKEETEHTNDRKSSKGEAQPAKDKKTPKKKPDSTEDFILRQKKRKKRRKLIIIAIILFLVIFIVFRIISGINKAKKVLEDIQASSYKTATVEKKQLYESKNATGMLYPLESRTLTTNLGTQVAKINKVNVEVGDYVQEGDILVEFSTEDIDKSIQNQLEDISNQRKQDAIAAEDAQREYVYSYSTAATGMQSSAKDVERKLYDLHEACDEYGDAKRKLQEIKDKDADEYGGDKGKETAIAQQESVVSAAYQKQLQAQRTYDDAVQAQATGNSGIADVANNLSKADSAYKKQQVTANNQVTQLERKLEDLEDSLDDYVIKASMNGIITEVNVSEGNKLQQSNDILTIQDVSGYNAEVMVDEYDIPKVKKAFEEAKAKGDTLEVVVKTEATGDSEYKGHVDSISPTSTATAKGKATSTTQSDSSVEYKVTVTVDEIDPTFMVGMSAKVAIVVDKSPENALCVPYNAVEEKSDGTCVLRVIDEKGTKSVYGDEYDKMQDSINSADRSGSDGKRGTNGIIVENGANDRGSNNKDKDKEEKGLSSVFSKLTGNDGDAGTENAPKYREVKVEKMFETDYYAAVVPLNDSEIKVGDTVMLIADKNENANDLMSMFRVEGGGR